MSDKNYKSSNLIKRKKKILHLKIIGLFISVILSVIGLAYLSNSNFVKISEVSINDTTFFDKKEIEKIVRDELKGKYLMIFAKDNVLLFPKNKIETRIKNFNRAIKTGSIKISNLRKISVQVEEYKPTAVWCDETNCYYINEKSLIFDKALANYDKNLVQFYDLIHDDPIGKNYSNPETFQKIIILINLVAKVPMKITSINTEDGLTFNLHTDMGTRLLYEINDSPEEVASNLNTVLEKDAINKAQLNNIDYIDLRFGNKVYYKIR